jgi:hypothetical protein
LLSLAGCRFGSEYAEFPPQMAVIPSTLATAIALLRELSTVLKEKSGCQKNQSRSVIIRILTDDTGRPLSVGAMCGWYEVCYRIRFTVVVDGVGDTVNNSPFGSGFTPVDQVLRGQ